MVETMPVHDTLFQYWRKNTETEPLLQALRFLMLSNFGYMGKGETIKVSSDNAKAQVLKNATACLKHFDGNIKMLSCDFREVLKKFAFRIDTDANNRIIKDAKDTGFIYADPPYLNTANNYQSGFTENDTIANPHRLRIRSNSSLVFTILTVFRL
jgi:DNA adenine methylase